MTTIHIDRPLARSGAAAFAVDRAGAIDRLEAYFTAEAAKGNVALRLMALGTAVSLLFAALGYAIFGPGNQHQFFRDIGPVTALAAAQTFAVGFVGLLIARQLAPSGGVRRLLNFWFLAGAGFLLMTFDAPLDLHGRLGKLIATQTTIAEDIGFHATSDAILAVYMLVGLVVATLNWREMLRHPRVLVHLMVGGFFIVGAIGIDGFAHHSSWMWVLEEQVELLGLAWIVGAFAVRLNAARRASTAAPNAYRSAA